MMLDDSYQEHGHAGQILTAFQIAGTQPPELTLVSTAC